MVPPRDFRQAFEQRIPAVDRPEWTDVPARDSEVNEPERGRVVAITLEPGEVPRIQQYVYERGLQLLRCTTNAGVTDIEIPQEMGFALVVRYEVVGSELRIRCWEHDDPPERPEGIDPDFPDEHHNRALRPGRTRS